MNAVLLLTLISLSQSGNGTKTINGSLKLQRHKIWKEKDNQLGEWCFNYRLRRRTLYYLTNLILPCILIASMVFLKGIFFFVGNKSPGSSWIYSSTRIWGEVVIG